MVYSGRTLPGTARYRRQGCLVIPEEVVAYELTGDTRQTTVRDALLKVAAVRGMPAHAVETTSRHGNAWRLYGAQESDDNQNWRWVLLERPLVSVESSWPFPLPSYISEQFEEEAARARESIAPTRSARFRNWLAWRLAELLAQVPGFSIRKDSE